MEQPAIALLGIFAIIFVPTIGFFAVRELIKQYSLTDDVATANKYSLLTGGLSFFSVIPSVLLIKHALTSRAHLIYHGAAEVPYKNAYHFEDLSADVRSSVHLAISDGAAPIPADANVPSEFVIFNQYTSYEFSVVTDVVLFGHPVNEIYVLLLFMTVFTAFWGVGVLSYLIHRDTDEQPSDEESDEMEETTDDGGSAEKESNTDASETAADE